MAGMQAVVIALLCATFSGVNAASLLQNGTIPSLGASEVLTVSGLSAGAFAAVQFHVAFSASVNASGVLAGGPYFCAEGEVAIAETDCMKYPEQLDVDKLIKITNDLFLQEKSIDDPKNMADDRVWVLSATHDTVVHTGVVEDVVAYYSNWLTDVDSQLKSNFEQDGEHAFLTDGVGNSCNNLGSPYINNCRFDAAGDILQHLFNNNLTEPTIDNDGALEVGSIVTFDQSKYLDTTVTLKEASMYSTGYIYIPDQCADSNSGCRVHVAFHGCQQTIDDIDTEYITMTGYNRWAAANDMIILYPQAMREEINNPEGCFDWWGYTNIHYATKNGIQNKAVFDMAQDLM